MLDDQTLTDALREEAASIDLPHDGARHVLEAARAAAEGTTPSVVSALVPRRRRARLALAAAAAILVAFAVSLPLVQTGPSGVSHTLATGPRVPAGFEGQSLRYVNGAFHGYYPTNGPVQFGTSQAGIPSPSWKSATQATALDAVRSASSARVQSEGAISLVIAADGLQRAMAKLTTMTTQLGGYVASTHVAVGTGPHATSTSGTIVLRVPEPRFGLLVAHAQRVGHAVSVRTTSTDVTSQYVDLQARIAALEVSRQQYLSIMAKASSIPQILAVQTQVNEIQRQIEQLKGELIVLTNETAYGTLDVSMGQAGHLPSSQPQPSSGLATAWHQSIHGFVVGVEGVVRAAGPALFALLCLLALFFIGRAAWRASRRRMI